MYVDCEFNRDHDDVKKLTFYPKKAKTNDTDAKTVFPDIIVHMRGPKGPNLLVIEAKKSTNRRQNNEDTDRQKLEAFKNDPHLKYEHAVFLKFHTGDENPGVGCIEFI